MKKLGVEETINLVRKLKTCAFYDDISELEAGESIIIPKTTWVRKTNARVYYSQKLRNIVKVLETSHNYIIIKL
jgi:hypothetical protein